MSVHIPLAFLPASAKAVPLSDKTAAPEKAAFPEKSTNAPQASSLSGSRSGPNPNLDSFEAVMEALDAELKRHRNGSAAESAEKDRKGKGRAVVEEEEDIEAALEAELRATLEREEGDDEPADYNLIKNFLESFKSQGGLSGPVSSLAGRLQPGWHLPRDDSS